MVRCGLEHEPDAGGRGIASIVGVRSCDGKSSGSTVRSAKASTDEPAAPAPRLGGAGVRPSQSIHGDAVPAAAPAGARGLLVVPRC